jgi:hypothetical protein
MHETVPTPDALNFGATSFSFFVYFHIPVIN